MTGVLLALILIAVAIAAVPVSRARTGDFFPPTTLFLVAWAGTLGLYFLRLLPYPPMNAATAVLLAGSIAAVLAGAVVGQRLIRPRGSRRASVGAVAGSNRWVVAYSAFGLAGTAWYLWLVWHTLGLEAIRNPMLVRRALGEYEIPSAFLFLEFFCIAAPLVAVALWSSGKRLSGTAIAGALGCAAATWLTTDRTQFFTVVLGAFFIFVFSRGRRLSLTGLAVAAACAGLLLASSFLIIGAALGKTSANLGVQLRLHGQPAGAAAGTTAPASGTTPTSAGPGPIGDRIALLVARGTTLYLYATGSYGALNTLLEQPLERTNGRYSAYPVVRLLERLKLIDGPAPTYIPADSPLRLQGTNDIRFNGYTFLYYPFVDFGLAGALAYAAAIGLLSGAVYEWAASRRDSPLALLVVAHLSIALALSIFVNKFNNTASWYIAAVCFLPFIGGLFRRRTEGARRT